MEEATHNDRQIIDEIIYLASLVSEHRAVDPILDVLRAVTATMQPNMPLPEADRARILEAKQALEAYLMHQDPVQTYTREELERKLRDKFGSDGATQQVDRTTSHEMVIIGSSTLAAYAIGIAALPGTFSLPMRFLLAVTLPVAVLNSGVAWLFWSGRKGLTADIQRAYAYFCGGVLFAAVGAAQFPFIFAFPELAETPFFRYAGFMVPFPVMCLLFYLGIRLYAQRLNIRSRLTHLPSVVMGAIVFGLVLSFAPHPTSVPEEAFFDLSIISTGLSAFFSAIAALVGFRITSTVTARYAQGMRMLSLTQVGFVIACSVLTGIIFISGPTTGKLLSIAAAPFIIPQTLQMISAFLLKRNARQ
ncbi:MAG TPA: hypothetical protein VFM05_05175 [Candidatus Saccharimonadales bacterium]|nr:hypothetical protein [Candidatus Saccharimonadales bacterium]